MNNIELAARLLSASRHLTQALCELDVAKLDTGAGKLASTVWTADAQVRKAALDLAECFGRCEVCNQGYLKTELTFDKHLDKVACEFCVHDAWSKENGLVKAG